jgi:hypothetical protein
MRDLLALIDSLPKKAREETFPFEDRDRNVRDVLGHLHEWHKLFETWYREGMSGRQPEIPAPGYTWRTLPALNRDIIWKACQGRGLQDTRSALERSHRRIHKLIEAHTDDELFTKKRYPWTGSTSLGAYLISATSSHYDWALAKLRRYARGLEVPQIATTKLDRSTAARSERRPLKARSNSLRHP